MTFRHFDSHGDNLRYFLPVETNREYKEKINPPLSWLSFIYFMYLSIAFAVWVAFDISQGLITLALLTATMPLLWIKMRMVITVDSELRVDRAHIELKYLKNAVAVDEAQYKLLRTTQSDARAFHATRPWAKKGVQVFVNDERDATSYWLIGSNNPEALAKSLS